MAFSDNFKLEKKKINNPKVKKQNSVLTSSWNFCLVCNDRERGIKTFMTIEFYFLKIFC